MFVEVLFPLGLHHAVLDGCGAYSNDSSDMGGVDPIYQEVQGLECEVTEVRKDVS